MRGRVCWICWNNSVFDKILWSSSSTSLEVVLHVLPFAILVLTLVRLELLWLLPDHLLDSPGELPDHGVEGQPPDLPLVHPLGHRVQEDSGDRHHRADHVLGAYRVLENEDGGRNHDHALQAVSDRVGDGGNLGQDGVGDQDVGESAQPGEEGPPQQPRGGLRGDRGEPASRCGSLLQPARIQKVRHGEHHDAGAGGDAGEEVDLVQNVRVHASLLGLVGLGGHVLLAKHVSELEGEVAAQSKDKAAPSEGGLSERGEDHPGHNWHEGEHADHARNGAQDDRREDGGEEGLQRLDGVREGHGDRA
mmetsp:Transcript_10599/g.36629  ORF Transcript_10599/g.36629 Transcript_10599/m.36629 type:complete len:305 (+) Transcript_10599:1289-2203(+)